MANILIIDDNDTLREGVAQVVKRMGHHTFTASNGKLGLSIFKKKDIDFTITDLKMDGLDGLDVLRLVKKDQPHALVMIITAYGTIDTAVGAMKAGAFDFITKPFPPDVLRVKVKKALDVRDLQRDRERLEDENEVLRSQLTDNKAFDTIVGESDPLKAVFKIVQKVSLTDSTVFITGESGTGKELVARAIHESSHRNSGPFIKINCGALPESLLESELFGHEKGAFTGAIRRKLGRFELAHKGTIFLDEIGDISQVIQLKLLRVLQEREFERVGGEDTIKVDVRVVTATNRDMKKEVEKSAFREDLYYRLHILPIHLPALRHRAGDIPLLAEHFIQKLAKRTRTSVKSISNDALNVLMKHSWPGNVRELENIIEQALVFADEDVILPIDFPNYLTGASSSNFLTVPEDDHTLPEILESLESQLIMRAFKKAKGVKTETARLLGIKTSALYYKLEKYGIEEGK